MSYTLDGEPYCDVTINLPNKPSFDEGDAFIDSLAKDCGLEKALLDKKIIKKIVDENIQYNMGHYDYIIFDIEKLKEYDPIGFLNMDIEPFIVHYDGKEYNLIMEYYDSNDQAFVKYGGVGNNFDLELLMRYYIHNNMPELEDSVSFVDGKDLIMKCNNFDDIKKLSLEFSEIYNNDYKYELLIQKVVPYFESFRENPTDFGFNFDKNVNI